MSDKVEKQQHLRIGDGWTLIVKTGSGNEPRDLIFSHDEPDELLLYAQAVVEVNAGRYSEFTLVEMSPESDAGKEMAQLLGQELGSWQTLNSKQLFILAWAISSLSDTINRMERIRNVQEIMSGERQVTA